MMVRCYNPKVRNYRLYGGRGILVCRRWRKFENFLVDMGKRPAGTTLDRRDGNKGYNPANCRWATPTVQQANKRTPITDAYRRRILLLCRKPKRLVDLPERMGLHFEIVRLEVRRLVAMQLLTKKWVPGNRPRGRTLLLQTATRIWREE